MNNNQNEEAMTLSPRNTLIPKLRFPKFELAEAWVTKPLGSIGQTLNGLSGKSGDDFGQGKPFITYKQVFDCASVDLAKCELVKIGENENQNEIKRGDILFTTSSETPDEVGYASVVLSSPSEPVYLNSFCFSFRPNSLNELVPEFSRYLFHSPIYRKLVIVLAQGSTRFNISKVAFLKLALPLPQTEEQKKIAEFLAPLDERIDLEKKKLATLKIHKEGLMQQLFPSQDESLPRLRFPEFQDAENWEEKALGELADRCTRKNSQGKFNRVLTNSAEFGVIDQRDFFDKDIASQDKLAGYFIVEKGDYVYNPRISTAAPVGPISRNNVGTGVMSPLYTVFRFKDCRNDFYAFYFKTTGWHRYMRQASSTGARHDRMAITNGDFLAMPLPVTDSNEQQKIADCLTSLDGLISVQAEKVAALIKYKKGLMQRVFPAPHEVRE